MIKRLTIVVLTIILFVIIVIACFVEVFTAPLCYIIFNRLYWFKKSILYNVLDIYEDVLKLIKQ